MLQSGKVIFFRLKTWKPPGGMKTRCRTVLEDVWVHGRIQFRVTRPVHTCTSREVPMERDPLVQGAAWNWRWFPWDHPRRQRACVIWVIANDLHSSQQLEFLQRCSSVWIHAVLVWICKPGRGLNCTGKTHLMLQSLDNEKKKKKKGE